MKNSSPKMYSFLVKYSFAENIKIKLYDMNTLIEIIKTMNIIVELMI